MPDGADVFLEEQRFSNGSRRVLYPDSTVSLTTSGPSAGWSTPGSQLERRQITTPAGRSQLLTSERMIELADPADPFSVVSDQTTVSINGRSFVRHYDGAMRRSVWTTPEGRRVEVGTDALGRVTASRVGDFAPMELAYDSLGRLAEVGQGTGADRRTRLFTYGTDGRLATVTDPLGRVTRYSYDPLGQVTRKTLADSREIGYSWDPAGHLIGLVPPGRSSHGFQYEIRGLSQGYSPPLAASSGGAFGYTYDLDRDLSQVQRPDGTTLGFTYDSGGRLTFVTGPSGARSYTYRPGTKDLATLSAPGGIQLAYQYDGFLLTGTTWSGPVAGSVQRLYNNDFQVTRETVNGSAVNFLYDRDGLLTGAGALTLSRDAASGLVATTTLGSITTLLGRNDFGELVASEAAHAGNVLYDTRLERDKAGRISRKVETLGGATDTYDYLYDLDGRLTGVDKNGTAFSRYDYDENGNRVSYTGPFGSASGTYDAQDRMISYGSASYTYRPGGELESKTVSGATVHYQYDELGNLLAVDLPSGIQIEYLIDGKNRRIGKKVNGTLVKGFLYRDELAPVAELDGAGNLVARFVYGSRPNVPDYIEKAGVRYRIVADHLGSPRLVIRATDGVVVQRMDYDEFGRVTLDTNPGFQPFGFAGGLYDPQTGLVRFGARDYDPETGRWTAKDPILFSSGSTNVYLYVSNDPVNFTDPSGLVQCTEQQKKFFDDLCGPIKELAEKYGFDPNFLLALSAYESGWLGDHGRELNNAFGLTNAGGPNLEFGNLGESVEYWGRNFGEKARGAKDINDFVQKLQTDQRDQGGKGKYNTATPGWDQKVKDVYDSVMRRVEECGCDK